MKICDKAMDVGLFGTALSICCMAGAGGRFGTAVSLALVGGKPLVDAVRGFSKKIWD